MPSHHSPSPREAGRGPSLGSILELPVIRLSPLRHHPSTGTSHITGWPSHPCSGGSVSCLNPALSPCGLPSLLLPWTTRCNWAGKAHSVSPHCDLLIQWLFRSPWWVEWWLEGVWPLTRQLAYCGCPSPLIPILHLWGCLAQDRPLEPLRNVVRNLLSVQGSRAKGSKSLITCDWPASPSPWSVSLHSSASSTALP